MRSQSLNFTQRKQMMAAIKFYYEKVLGKPKMYFNLGKEVISLLLPVYLAFPKIRMLLERVRTPHDKLILFLAYHVNLSPREIAALKAQPLNEMPFYQHLENSKPVLAYLESLVHNHLQNLSPTEYLFKLMNNQLMVLTSGSAFIRY
jgi:hypothetical protein